MKWKNIYNYILIALITFVVYGKAIAYEFNLDDEYVTTGNARVEKGFAGITEIVNGYYYEDDMGYKYGYRPVAQISFAIEHQLFGGNAHFSHFINISLYILICCLIFYFLKDYAGFENKYLPILITLVFLLHPLHVEAVASIKNREELSAFLFPFLALIIALKAIDGKRWYLFVFVAFFNFLAIYSKQSSIALIVSIPLLLLLIRRLSYSNLTLVYFSFYPFLFLALRDSMDYPKLAFLFFLGALCFIVFSWMFYNFKRNSAFFMEQLLKNGSKFYLVFIVALSSYLCLKGQYYYVFFAIIPLIVLLKKGIDTYIKLSILFPVLLFLFISNEFTLFGLVILILYQSNWGCFEKTPINKEILFITIYILVTVFISIQDQDIDLGYVPYVVFLSFVFFQKKRTVYSKYFLFILPLIYFVDSFPIEDSSLNNILAFFFSIYIVMLSFNIFSLQKTYSKLNLSLLTLIACTLFLFYNLDSSSFQFELPSIESSELINPNYQHQNTIYESRVIDLTENPIYHYNSLMDHNGLILASTLFYIQKFFAPYPLSSYYGYNIIQPIRNPLIQYIIIGFIILLVGWLIYFLRKKKLLLWMLFLALISLVSISNYYEVISGIVGDRLAFTFVLPLSVLLLHFLFFIFNKQVKVLYSLLLLLLFTFSILSYSRVSNWESPMHLFTKDVSLFPQSAKLHSLLGSTIMKNQSINPSGFDITKVKTAQFHFEQSIKIYPDFFNSHYDLARVNDLLNEKNEAIKQYEYVIQKDSTFYDVYLDLADLYLQTNNPKNAANNLEAYLSYAGFNLDLYFQLSNIVYQLGDYQKVISLNQKIIQQNAQIPEAYLNIAYAYGHLGDIKLLKKYLKLGENLTPEHPDAKIIRQKFL